METSVYDYVIIGGGVAGLYAAYVLQKQKIAVVEKHSEIGGRLAMTMFEGKKIEVGAGVGRFGKDVLLQKLLTELKMSVNPVKTSVQYAFSNPLSLKDWHKQLLSDKISANDRKHLTFKEYFIKKYGKNVYEQFVLTTGYTDYEQADVVDTIQDYGFEDVYHDGSQDIFFVDWMELAQRLAAFTTVFTDFNVQNISYNEKIFTVKSNTKSLKAHNVVFATDRPGWNLYSNKTFQKLIAPNVVCQPFLRAYAKVKSDKMPKQMTLVSDQRQKVIPMGDDVYMVAYADNRAAEEAWELPLQSYEKLFGGVHFENFVKFYWKCGTHYYKPLDTEVWKNRKAFIDYASHPEEHVYVVGELISQNQGWVEGALESVHKALSK